MTIKRHRTAQVTTDKPTEVTMHHPGLRRRKNTWFYRARVPADLRHQYNGKFELSVSLKTQEYAAAVIRMHEEAARIHAEFQRHRRGPSLVERMRGELLRPLADPALSDAQKLDHIRTEAAKFKRTVPLSALVDYWEAQVHPRKRTAQEGRYAIQQLRKVSGVNNVTLITRDHAIALRDLLVSKGRAPETVRKQLGMVKAIYSAALADGKFGLTTNPITGIVVRGRGSRKRRTWTQQDIEAFHQAHPEGALRDLLDLLRWTGARLGEICGLRGEDVRLDGQPHLVIVEHEGRGLKNEGSARHIPLRAEVIGAAQRVAAGALRGVTTPAWSKRFNRARRALGIPEDAHALRHSFKYAWRASGLPEDQGDAIQGHSNGAVSRTYGSADGYPLAPLYASVLKLKFE